MNDQAYLKRRQVRCALLSFAALTAAAHVLSSLPLPSSQLRHQQTLASSDKRAVAWSALECLVLAGLSGLQMVFFRRAFKNY